MKIIILLAAALMLAACGSPASNGGNGSNLGNGAPAAQSPKPAESPAANANAAKANENANVPAKSDEPKRVSFAKGTTEATEQLTLAPGAVRQFVLGVTGAQTLFIEPGSPDLTFRTVRGILGEMIKADDGTYSAETKGNNAARGDIVFEVKNPTKKEIKTSIKIAVEDFAD